MYNRSHPANLRHQADPANVCLHFIAVRAIAAAEELSVNDHAYAGGAEWHDDAWFERMGIEPHAEEQPGDGTDERTCDPPPLDRT
jgi:hypothetical protein